MGDQRDAADHETRLDEAVAAYLQEAEGGTPPDRAAFVARFPDLSDELDAFLDDRERVLRLVGPPEAGSRRPPTPRPCPHCHAKLAEGAAGAACPGCGARFRLDEDAATLPVNRRLGRFELTAVAGRGAFGAVYKAWDPDLDREVAVKVLRAGAFAAPKEVEQFLREARCAVRLHHPGIVRVFESGLADGMPYLVSEFVPGRTLAGLLREHRPTPAEAAGLLVAVADALHFAHQQGVVHRDVKPSNVLLRGDGAPVVTDFGLARLSGGGETLTLDGEAIGTPAYMSPEQARGSAGVDRRTDVYSLGVVLYQMLTGHPPFAGPPRLLLLQHLHDEPRPPRAQNDQLPRDLETVCLKCLRKDPARRYSTAAALADDLRRFQQGRPVLARPEGRAERLVRWGRRNPALAVAGGVAVALLVATASVSAAWAIHADRQSVAIRTALDESRRVTAETERDRGIDEAERGDVGPGMLWMARSLGSAPDHAEDLTWTVRVNLTAWRRQLVTLTDCVAPPSGRVLAIAPDERSAWFVDPDRQTVRCWDLGSARVVGPTLRHGGTVTSLAVSPDGTRVACGVKHGGVLVWDAATGNPEASPDQSADVGAVAYYPDGRLLIHGTEKGNGPRNKTTSRVWDGVELRPLGVVLDQSALVTVAAAPDGRALLAAGPADKEFRRWDAVDGRLRDTILRHPALIKTAAVSPNGRRVLTGADDRVARLWDIETGRLCATLHHRTPVTAVAFGKDGKTLRTAAAGDAVRVWAVPDEPPAGPHAARVRGVAVGPDGRLVATGANDGQVRLWETATGRLVPVGQPLPHRGPVFAVVFSPDGKLLATTTHQNPGAQLWDVATGDRRAFLRHEAIVHRVVFSPDGRWAATAGYGQEVWVWDVQTGQPAPGSPLRHEGTVLTAAFSPDGRMLVTAGEDRMARRWDPASGVRLGEPLPHGDAVQVAAFHPTDARLLLTAGDDGVARLWDVGTGRPAGPPLPHGYPIWVAGFAPDGRTVLTGGRDGKTRVWECATGREVGLTLRQGGRVRAVAASPTGRWAVTASEDGTARLWAIQSGRPIGPPVRHDATAWCAAIDPGGRWAVTAGEDRTARLLPAPAEFPGTPEQITSWVQVVTGAELDSSGDLRPLDPAAWRQRRDAHGTPAGLPVP